MRRARRLPALVMGPRLTVSPVELSEAPGRDMPSARAALKPREIADLRQERRRRNEIDAPHRHQRRDHLGQRPIRTAARIACSSRSMRSCAWRIASIISSKTMRCSGYSSFWLASQLHVRLGPGLLRPDRQALPQQERRDLLALRSQILHRRFARPREITHRLVTRSGTHTAVSSPARNSFTRLSASRRLVFTRSPGFFGISEGATTMHSCPRL